MGREQHIIDELRLFERIFLDWAGLPEERAGVGGDGGELSWRPLSCAAHERQ
jgi:hypothetical protein